MHSIKVKPASAGLQVPLPSHDFEILPEEGRTVPLDQYMRRRLAAGEVVEVKDTPAPAPKPAAAKTAPAADKSPSAS